MKRYKLLAAACAAVFFSLPLAQAASYPQGPVRIISPTEPGGTIDLLSRVISKALENAYGTPFVVEYRSGAATNIGSDHVAKAKPDGYTLLVNGAPLAANPWIFKNFPFDPVEDLAPVIELGEIPNVITVNPEVPAQTLPELIELLKADNTKYNYGTTGLGSSGHLAAELLTAKTGGQLTHIAYRGNAQAATDHIAGRLQVGVVNIPLAIQYVKEGRLRALAVTSEKRSALLPDVPTVSESLNIPDYKSTGWFGLFAPKGTPEAILQDLHEKIETALKDPQIISAIEASGVEVRGGTREALGTRLREESALAKELISNSGGLQSQ